jgi:poly-gamma-glutamate capsule biosynthesis protein CapA/YwtB (metallophosphatase superfamily)
MESRRNRPIAILGMAVLLLALAGCGSSGPSATVRPSPSAAATSPTPTPTPTPVPTPSVSVEPIVPVADFRSTVDSIGLSDVEAALAGDGQFDGLEVVGADAGPILAALGVSPSADLSRLTRADSADALAADLAANRNRLGVLRAAQVGPSVHALGWNGASLFGTRRATSLDGWPLMATFPASAATPADQAFDPSSTWTITAAGDVMLDRGVYYEVHILKRGVNFPFQGGTAEITGRTCCSSFGWQLPKTERTGNAGAVRALFRQADLAMVNLEGPAPKNATYHSAGTRFTFFQSLLAGLVYEGVDFASLGNNHIGDAGPTGIVQTVAALDKLGIEHAGAGADLTAARSPAMFTVDGVRVAVLAYDSIAPSYTAGPSRPGSAQLADNTYAQDIAAARAAGAQVVIVYPHWGTEYQAAPTDQQRAWAHAMIDAGADLVIGNHVHWAASMEVYKGKPIWYALGNFVFDQTWSEQTEEGLILELTFRGSTLVQAWMHPTVLLDASQPNLLDATSGAVVMNRVFDASKGLLPW